MNMDNYAIAHNHIKTMVQSSQWKAHTVRQINKDAAQIEFPAQLQILTESWNRVVAVPYIVYMPEIDRVLMLVNCDYGPNLQHVHYAMVLFSDDRGTIWSEPKYIHTNAEGKPDIGMGTGLTYLGKGKVLLYADRLRWFSYDYGKTWGDTVPVQPIPNGKEWNAWDPAMVEKDHETGKVVRLAETGYTFDSAAFESASSGLYSQGFIRFSTDEGRTWSDAIKVPEWYGVDEVALVRARNGNIVAACRTDAPDEFKKYRHDHYEGFGVSISRDNGYTWSGVNKLYNWGRHHPCMVLLPTGDIVMTYVVRLGYPDTSNGFPQFGIEAVVSHDNGETWDLDHRYILTSWPGNRKGPNAWWASSQSTSSILLPDGSILTAFGTGYRSQPDENGRHAPRDVGLVYWQIRERG